MFFTSVTSPATTATTTGAATLTMPSSIRLLSPIASVTGATPAFFPPRSLLVVLVPRPALLFMFSIFSILPPFAGIGFLLLFSRVTQLLLLGFLPLFHPGLQLIHALPYDGVSLVDTKLLVGSVAGIALVASATDLANIVRRQRCDGFLCLFLKDFFTFFQHLIGLLSQRLLFLQFVIIQRFSPLDESRTLTLHLRQPIIHLDRKRWFFPSDVLSHPIVLQCNVGLTFPDHKIQIPEQHLLVLPLQLLSIRVLIHLLLHHIRMDLLTDCKFALAAQQRRI
mmetsp:Transcript_57603/g.126050  ORF Transcript_57603/g.126050 Transcript_57603/m.126050 type:complete len:280 (-) Transcript_57603:197-1036(-)